MIRMAAEAIRWKIDRELYNGWIGLATPEPTDQF